MSKKTNVPTLIKEYLSAKKCCHLNLQGVIIFLLAADWSGRWLLKEAEVAVVTSFFF